MGRAWSFGFATLTLAGIAVVACGSASGSSFDENLSQDSDAGPSNGQLSNSASSDGSSVDFTGCATEQRKATPSPLDLYIMLDTSSSMYTQVAQGKSKYSAIVDAMNAFATDPSSAGINVGMQFFPLTQAGVPLTCSDNSGCPGNSGPCVVNVCNQPGPFIVVCTSKADCSKGADCLAVGSCSNDGDRLCFNLGGSCGVDSSGFDLGTCNSRSGACANSDSCTSADYSTPAVPFGALPDVAPAVASALAAHSPLGRTPTSAALKGALDAAVARARATTGHSVVAVLATDGLPTTCDTNINDIATIAATGLSAPEKIKTFVIGVFAPSEQATAKTNLDKVAAAGGTGASQIVTQGANTTQQFVDALNTVRGAALPCEYNLPTPESGTPDFDKLNVQHTAPDGKKTVYPNRSGAGACDPQAGGWYYDADPTTGATPTKIELCPATCDAVKSAGGQVDVVIGCKTIIK